MDLKAILEKHFSEEALTEEAKTEMEALFEASVNSVVEKKLEEAKTELEEKHTEELKTFKSDLVESLNDYMEEAFGEWFDENKPAMASEIKVSMAESTMKKLRGVLSENYVDIKEEDIDTVADLEAKLEEAKSKVDELGNTNIENKKQILEFEKAIQFTNISEGMSVNEKANLLKLVEDISANDVETFVEKVKIIKEKLVDKTDDVDENLKEEEKSKENPDKILKESNKDTDTTKKYIPKFY